MSDPDGAEPAPTSYVGRMRSRVGHDPLLVVAAGVVVHDDQGRVLLQRRSDDGTCDQTECVRVTYEAIAWSGELSTEDPETAGLAFFGPADLPPSGACNAALLSSLAHRDLL